MPLLQTRSDEPLALPIFHDDDEHHENNHPVPKNHPRSERWIMILSGILVAILLVGVVLSVLSYHPAQITYQSQAVTSGDLVLTITTAGPLQADVYNVTFTGNGKLTEIDVQVGVLVKKNQVLAKLDSTSLQIALDEAKAREASAQVALDNAQANYRTTLATTQATIVAAQKALNDAQANLKRVQAQSAANIAAAKTRLTNAQINLKMVQAQTQAQLAVAYDQEQQAIHACKTNPSPPPNCVQLAKDQYALAQAKAKAVVASAQNEVNAAQSTLNSVQTQADTQNTLAQNQVNAAQSALNTAQTQGAAQNTAAQNQVNTAHSQLNTAKGLLQTAQYNLNNATLKAPHDGTVTRVNGVVGGTPGVGANTVNANNNLFVQIVDLSSLRIQVNVNESDIGGVAVGEKVQFSVSAYKDRLFKGTVRAISPLGQTVSDMVTYPVFIDVDTKERGNVNLLLGMTAQVNIIIGERSNVLLVPVKAVNLARTAVKPSSNTNNRSLIDQRQVDDALAKARQMQLTLQQGDVDLSKDNPTPAFVLEYTNNTIVVKPVVIGLTNGTSYEVLAGLSTEDSVVVETQS